jgi:N-methylhydantoinase A
MRYIGQQTEVTVPLGRKSPTEKDSENFASMFEQEYQSIYGLSLDDMDIEIVAWRVSSFSLSESRFVDREVDIRLGAPKGRRSIYLGSEALTADVYDRETLGREQTLQGPCIIEERETTILILPNWRATVAKDGAVVAERMEGS